MLSPTPPSLLGRLKHRLLGKLVDDLVRARLDRTARLAFKSLWLHRMRSFLTVLGIVFGVCSVIAMLAIGEGASYEAQEEIKSLGSQNIILRSIKPGEEQKVAGAATEFVLTYGLTYKDVKAIKDTIPGVSVIVPGRIIREYIWNINRRVDAEIIGTVPWFPEMRNQRLSAGRFFTDMEMQSVANVCVLGKEAADALFPMETPLGNVVRVGGGYYRVVGIMEPRGKETKGDERASSGTVHRMFMPLETAVSRYGKTLIKRRAGSFEAERVELHEVTVKVEQLSEVLPVSQAIAGLLKRNHKKADYEMVVPLELLKRAEHTKRIFNIVLGSIAAISLLVGGIGIMNIMLATVTERTREIGIRRALGARRRDIVMQFLIESVILSGTGGVIGVALGITIPFLVSYFAGMKTIITVWSPLLAFSISAMVGVIFGLYPAQRAAQMDPVEALRHE
ncbi:MAG: ABC transporter permease [Verrucomicrobiota bacterium]